MCGITGCWAPPELSSDDLTRVVRGMADRLVHRGPDDSGTWVDEQAGVGLGFRRLAILDLSPSGHQPMVSADGRFVIIFNGEIYNYRELRDDLAAWGARFSSTSDTEVILYAAMRWGAAEMLERLWGMFAIALWDRQSRRLLLTRDRLGKKPLYYGVQGRTLVFGSELKALQAHPAFKAELDRDAVAQYVRFGYVPTPHSIYRGIRKLQPGHSITFAGPAQSAAPSAYWRPSEVAAAGRAARAGAMTDAEAIEEVDSLLRDAVARRMIADVPLGAFLSGGIDSTTVVALMQAQSRRPVRTFTIGFDVPGYNEAEAAKAVAQHLGTDHTELYVTPRQTLDVVPSLPHLYDEPFADSSQIPTFLVSQLARQHVTVALSGDGGDEGFGGYVRYQWAERIWRSARHIPQPLRRLASGAVDGVSPRGWQRVYDAIKWALPAGARQAHPADKLCKLAAVWGGGTADDIYLNLVSHWKQPDRVVVAGHEPEDLLGLASARAATPDFFERMMLLDLQTYLPDDILVKVDRASMGTSLEARAPLLDHRVIELAWRLPRHFKVRDGRGKWVLRQVLYRYVPKELVERPKMGFGVPVGPWLRHELRDWAEALLADRRLRDEGIFEPSAVRKLWQAHQSGERNAEYPLWVILMFQAWREAHDPVVRTDMALAAAPASAPVPTNVGSSSQPHADRAASIV
jgi:asparagine synthase (glutamine-hydrolysing)